MNQILYYWTGSMFQHIVRAQLCLTCITRSVTWLPWRHLCHVGFPRFQDISSSCAVLVFQHVDRPMSRSPSGLRLRHGGTKAGEELTAKLLRLDDLVRMENDVMEPKRKRSFPGNNAPLDRLSVSSMETKQATNKQR